MLLGLFICDLQRQLSIAEYKHSNASNCTEGTVQMDEWRKPNARHKSSLINQFYVGENDINLTYPTTKKYQPINSLEISFFWGNIIIFLEGWCSCLQWGSEGNIGKCIPRAMKLLRKTAVFGIFFVRLFVSYSIIM